MGFTDRVYAAIYDRFTAAAEAGRLGRKRAELLGSLSGRVLEIGAGTGVNLDHYGAIESLTVLEPNPYMARRFREKAARRHQYPIEVLELPAEAGLRFPDASFDAVVSTLVLCSVSDPGRVLRECRRVLRPGGRLTLIEHVRGPGWEGRAQQLAEPLWRRLAAGCRLTRDTRSALIEAGFDDSEVSAWSLPGIGPLIRAAIAGHARPRPGLSDASLP